MLEQGVSFEHKMKYILLLPLSLMLLLLITFPTIYSWYLSFHRAVLANYFEMPFTGLANYLKVLTDSDFWYSVWFSIRYATIVSLVELVLGFSIALFFNREMPGKTLIISLFLLPMMVSPALLGVMFRLLLNDSVGLFTYLLGGVSLLTSEHLIPVLIAIDVLQWTPFTFLILYSGLQTVPEELYEAAAIDGAGAPQNLFYITVPAVAPFLVIATLLRWLDSFKIFDMIFVLTGGGPGIMTTSLSIYIYKMAFQTGDFGRATAASILVLLAFSMPLVAFVRRARRGINA